MKILLNAQSLLSHKTGIGEYTFNLYNYLSVENNINVDLFTGSKFNGNLINLSKKLNTRRNFVHFFRDNIPFSYNVSRFLNQISFNNEINKQKYSIYHEPNFICFDSDIPVVLNVHDLSWIKYPETHPLRRIKSLEKYFPKSIYKANKIIVDSHFIKRELLNNFNINENDVNVIYLASKFKYTYKKNDKNLTNFLLNSNLKYKKFFICVGTLEPRKNLTSCINSYLLLPKSIRKNYPLLVIGPYGWKFEVPSGGNDETIRFLGYVDNQCLKFLYHSALGLLYLSIYEGFGLPPLEAMSCKTSTIVSNKGTLSELYGDNSISVNPDDYFLISKYLRRLIEDDNFQLAYEKKGFNYSKKFTWEQTAKKTISTYNNILSTS